MKERVYWPQAKSVIIGVCLSQAQRPHYKGAFKNQQATSLMSFFFVFHVAQYHLVDEVMAHLVVGTHYILTILTTYSRLIQLAILRHDSNLLDYELHHLSSQNVFYDQTKYTHKRQAIL